MDKGNKRASPAPAALSLSQRFTTVSDTKKYADQEVVRLASPLGYDANLVGPPGLKTYEVPE